MNIESDGNGKVKCKKCNNKVTPRLWREWDSLTKSHKEAVKHLCPVCGTTMYVTNRIPSWLWVLGFFVISWLAIAVIGYIEKYTSTLFTTLLLVAIVVIALRKKFGKSLKK